MEPELVWLVIGVVLVVSEVLALTLALGMLGVGAFVAAALALVGLGLPVQLLGFAGASAAMLLLVRPPIKAALDRSGTSERTDVRMLQGATAVVVERVSDETGRVRLNGELWRARPYAGGHPLDIGLTVSVAGVEGATLLVYSTDLT